jgi:hypothetical protein
VEQLIARAQMVNRPLQHSGGNDRLPEQHTKTRNHKNAKDTRFIGPMRATDFAVANAGQAQRRSGRPPQCSPHWRLSNYDKISACCFALWSAYVMRETSQQADRCAVVPLMGSRADGSTVRL